VHRNTDLPGLVRHSALHRLADPPGGVGRELVPPAPVELLHGTDEADDPLLDEVEQAEPMPLVLLRDRDDEPEIRVDHALLRLAIAPLDPLGELDLLLRREQRMAAD